MAKAVILCIIIIIVRLVPIQYRAPLAALSWSLPGGSPCQHRCSPTAEMGN